MTALSNLSPHSWALTLMRIKLQEGALGWRARVFQRLGAVFTLNSCFYVGNLLIVFGLQGTTLKSDNACCH